MPEENFQVVFDKASSKAASRFVVRGFLTPAELPQAVFRMFFTKDAVIYIVVPLVMLLLSYAVPEGWGAAWPMPPALVLTFMSSLWLIVSAAILLRMGKSHAIAVYAGNSVVGGIRLKVGSRRVNLAGVFVDSRWRGRGMFSALLLAAFELMAREAQSRSGIEFRVFAPAHPASKRIVQKYLGGKDHLVLDISAGSQFDGIIKMLRKEVKALSERSIGYEFRLSDSLYK